MADPPGSVRRAFDRLIAWLTKHAPRTRGSLKPAALEAHLEDLASEFRCVIPEGFLELYRCSAGQRLQSAGPAGEQSGFAGVFNGYYFMPLDGVDGVASAWDQMIEMAERGGAGASKELYAFAKDFAGNYLCVEGQSGAIVEIEDGEQRRLAASMQAFLRSVTADLQQGRATIQDQAQTEEQFEVVFDASRARTAGDAVTHSVFEALGVRATVVPLSEARQPSNGYFGMAVRIVPPTNNITVASVEKLVDLSGRAVPAEIGHSSGGGRQGYVVYVASRSPLPANSRLHVRLQRTQ